MFNFILINQLTYKFKKWDILRQILVVMRRELEERRTLYFAGNNHGPHYAYAIVLFETCEQQEMGNICIPWFSMANYLQQKDQTMT